MPGATNPLDSARFYVNGYQGIELISQGSRTTIYRAVETATQKPVVIKVLTQEYPSFSELIRFRNQYTVVKNLSIEGIVRPLDLVPWGNGYALIMEDFGGIDLEQYIQQQFRSPLDVLDIAIQLATILHQLHQHRVIHKDIKPSNILIHPDSKKIKLVDFSIASLLPKEIQAIQSPKSLEGTLAYMAPEQTGRMNRVIDYRTDFYALGVTLYQLLTNQLPFVSKAPLELIHCHMAQHPMSVDRVNPEVPAIVAAIVVKLMAKNAEDRYQSALGLKYDLEQCITQWHEQGEMTEFVLGRRDICDRFLIPEKLYGREADVQTLLDAFERVAQGSSDLMLVVGGSGIGKTAVINEVHKPIAKQNGYFIKGKFDQFNRNIPFSAFVQAFRDLVRQLLSESDTQLVQWKTQIQTTLNDNAQVIVDLIPELERIIGPQPPAPNLSGTEAQNRFNRLFQQFIQVFTTAEHPLVIFVDDLQWADAASLNLIQVLISEATAGYLLLLGAYRDNEVFPAHPLMLTLDGIAKAGIHVHSMTLQPLDEHSLNCLVADTLHTPESVAQPLTMLTIQKTQGNPFFATQFLKFLHQEQLITFDRSAGHWSCDIVKIRNAALTDDVVEFMVQQLQKLPASTQTMLKLAACTGTQFNLDTLGIVSEHSQTEVATALWQGLQEGLILPQSNIYKFYVGDAERLPDQQNETLNYRFLHDRVQQAAYTLIPENEKQATHLTIGRLLIKNTPQANIEERIFEIVNQFNMGAALITTPSEKETLTQLNLIAGRKAKLSTAYGAAVNYLAIGLSAVAGWQQQYAITLALHEEAAEAAYLNGDFGQMNRWLDAICENAAELLDTVKAHEVKIQAFIAQDNPAAAIKTALDMLQKLGIRLPERPNQYAVAFATWRTQRALAGRCIEDLANLPIMTEPTQLAAMGILANAISPASFSDHRLFLLLSLKALNLSLKYGNVDVSAYAYGTYGQILCGLVGDIDQGYQFGQLALTLVTKLNATKFKAKVLMLVNDFVVHWQAHVRDTLPPFIEAYRSGLEAGDLEFAARSAMVYGYHSYFLGQDLVKLEDEIKHYTVAIRALKQTKFIYMNERYRQIVLNLLGQSSDPCRLVGEAYDEDQLLPLHFQANDGNAIFNVYFHKAILCYLFGDNTQAAANIAQAKERLATTVGLLFAPLFHFYESLIRLALFSSVSKGEQSRILRQVNANQRKMKHWADHAPMNHLHKFYLVEAERQRVLRERGAMGKCQPLLEAIATYDRAIALAEEHDYINESALAHELAAKFCLSQDKVKFAQVYMTDAYYRYGRWGAKAKTDDLEQRYPRLLVSILQQPQLHPIGPRDTLSSSLSRTTASADEVLDLAALMKAARVLSKDIDSDDLTIANLMTVIQESAGAETVALMLLHNGNLMLEAKLTNGQIQRLEAIPIDNSQAVPLAIVNTVKRTNTPLVLADARVETDYIHDVYIQNHQPRSILCLPLSDHRRQVGILYLENNQCPDTFTENRVETLTLLCAQAAITLENARLYQQVENYSHSLEAEVQRKTQDLNQKNKDLEQALTDLKQTQAQLIQSEKMSSVGQMVAGIAHEINNPVSFIKGNLEPLERYIQDLHDLLSLYQNEYPQPHVLIQAKLAEIDLDFLVEDVTAILRSMNGGSDRIQQIVLGLRNFSRLDESSRKTVDIHSGIDSTLLLVQHRLNGTDKLPQIEIIPDYKHLPLITCYPSQLNQVFLNIINNAIDAIRDNPNCSECPKIRIHTAALDAEQIRIKISNTDSTIPQDVQKHIFDPFFTTKPVGSGRGLGLFVSYSIIQNHGGTLTVRSQLKAGTTFEITLPHACL